MRKTNVKLLIRELRVLLKLGVISFPSLVWNIENQIKLMMENDFSTINLRIASLDSAIAALPKSNFLSTMDFNFSLNYGSELHRAKSILLFWYELILSYYKVENNEFIPPRYLPLSRKLIKFDSTFRATWKELCINNKIPRKSIQKNIKENKIRSSRLLVKSKKRRTESNAIRTEKSSR